MSTAEGFTLIMFFLGVSVTALGWYVKRQIARGDQERRETKEAINGLTRAIAALNKRIAQLRSRHGWWR